MIEVFLANDGWRWRFICFDGRELLTSSFAYVSQQQAMNVAKQVRMNFFSACSEVDHRQGACV